MQNALVKQIKFDGKFYNESDDSGKVVIQRIADRLRGLEKEIMAEPQGVIAYSKAGTWIIDSFKKELADRISERLQSF